MLLQLGRPAQKLYLPNHLLSSMNNFCSIKVLGNTSDIKDIKTIMISKKIRRMSVQKAPLQKTYEMSVGSDSINVDFFVSNKKFDRLEISLVYD